MTVNSKFHYKNDNLDIFLPIVEIWGANLKYIPDKVLKEIDHNRFDDKKHEDYYEYYREISEEIAQELYNAYRKSRDSVITVRVGDNDFYAETEVF